MVETLWEDPVAAFRWRLENDACTRLLEDKAGLAKLRHNWKKVRYLAKLFERVLEDRKISLEERVFLASVAPVAEHWDEEDDQKSAEASRQFAFRGVPSSTQEWDELESHRNDCRLVKKDTTLPPDLTQMCMDFRGPNPIEDSQDSDDPEDQADPWLHPVI
jgi:hypothetical protein